MSLKNIDNITFLYFHSENLYHFSVLFLIRGLKNLASTYSRMFLNNEASLGFITFYFFFEFNWLHGLRKHENGKPFIIHNHHLMLRLKYSSKFWMKLWPDFSLSILRPVQYLITLLFALIHGYSDHKLELSSTRSCLKSLCFVFHPMLM